MPKDLENLLKRVIIPIEKPIRFSFFGWINFPILTPRNIRIIILKIGVLMVIVTAASMFLFNGQAEKEDIIILKNISKYVVLPEEEPTIAKVINIDRLKDEPFFKNAKNGDTMFVFIKSDKVILYSVIMGKVINIGSIKDAGLVLK